MDTLSPGAPLGLFWDNSSAQTPHGGSSQVIEILSDEEETGAEDDNSSDGGVVYLGQHLRPVDGPFIDPINLKSIAPSSSTVAHVRHTDNLIHARQRELSGPTDDTQQIRRFKRSHDEASMLPVLDCGPATIQHRVNPEAEALMSNDTYGTSTHRCLTPDEQTLLTGSSNLPSAHRPVYTQPEHEQQRTPEEFPTSAKKRRIAPYYDDSKFGVRMYRGPGFEQFPVALGKNLEHRLICEQWDREEARRAQRRSTREFVRAEFGSLFDDSFLADSGDEENEDGEDREGDELSTAAERACFEAVLEVFPDISHLFALNLIRKHSQDMPSTRTVPGAESIVEMILQQGDYPKHKVATEIEGDGTGETIQRSKGVNNLHKSSKELASMVSLLAGEFLFVPTHHIYRICCRKSLYDAFMELYRHETEHSDLPGGVRPYKRYRRPRVKLEKKYGGDSDMLRRGEQWAELVNELQAARQQIARDERQSRLVKETQAAEEANFQSQRQRGEMVECQCCFEEEVPLNRSVSCEGAGMDSGAHQYCFSCVSRLAGDRVGSMRFEMLCMSSDGCQAPLKPSQVQLAVAPRVWEKLAYFQQQAEIEAAGIEGLEQCPSCEFRGICEPVEVDWIFSCQNPDCRRVSCRKCKERAHDPKTCEQVKQEQEVARARHLVEEARSEAMMRTCPKCKKRLIKEFGCNKMRCTCGGSLCYACQKDITKIGYDHFMKPPTMCPHNDIPTFDRHQVEADAAERNTIKRIRAEHVDFDEAALRIGTAQVDDRSDPVGTQSGVQLVEDGRNLAHLDRSPNWPPPQAFAAAETWDYPRAHPMLPTPAVRPPYQRPPNMLLPPYPAHVQRQQQHPANVTTFDPLVIQYPSTHNMIQTTTRPVFDRPASFRHRTWPTLGHNTITTEPPFHAHPAPGDQQQTALTSASTHPVHGQLLWNTPFDYNFHPEQSDEARQ